MKYSFFILILLAICSCKSSKKVADADMTQQPQQTVTIPSQQVQPSQTEQPSRTPGENAPCLTARIRATVTMDGKDISTSGTLRMRQDDVILLSLLDPILGITEVGRVEMSQNDFLVIDRLNKRYVKARYDEVQFLRQNGIGFSEIQEHVWNEVQNKDELSFTLPAKKNITIDLSIGSRSTTDTSWEGHTTLSSRYSKVELESLFKAMMNYGL